MGVGGNRIDLFEQVKAFDYLCLTSLKGMTGNYRSVYFALLSINNSKYWSELFEVDFQYVLDLSRVDKDTYRRAMDFLQENGLFDQYIKGINKYARAKISLKVLTEKPTGNTGGTKVSNKVSNADANTVSSAHYNKTVDRKTNTLKKTVFVPPALFEVENFFIEKGFSKESAAKAWNYYEAGNWHDQSGNQVKNWKQKMIAVWLKPDTHPKLKNNSPVGKGLSLIEQSQKISLEFDNEELHTI